MTRFYVMWDTDAPDEKPGDRSMDAPYGRRQRRHGVLLKIVVSDVSHRNHGSRFFWENSGATPAPALIGLRAEQALDRKT